jgi:GNAT superfamily N-acetyltransferase
MAYRIRPATLADRAVLVHHRLSMFADIGVPSDAGAVAERFTEWLGEMMPAQTYRAWLVETDDGEAVAGGGMSVLPWPPGPRYLCGRTAFVYNLYTEPAHRRQGLARLVMETIHAWCRENGPTSILLNASTDGRALYEGLGYAVTTSPMMSFGIDP